MALTMCKEMCNNMCSIEGVMGMATNLALDDRLLETALKIGGLRTKRETVNEALREFIARRQQRRVLDLFGKIDWDPRYRYKAGRSR